MLKSLPNDVIIHIYYTVIGFDEGEILNVDWTRAAEQWACIAAVCRDFRKLFGPVPRDYWYMSSRLKARATVCRDELDLNSKALKLDYLYGPIDARAERIANDAVDLPMPEILGYPATGSNFIDKFLTYRTLCVPMGRLIRMSEAEQHTLYSYKKDMFVMNHVKPCIVHNPIDEGRSYDDTYLIIVFTDVNEGEDGDEFARMVYMFLPNQPSLEKLRLSLIAAALSAYPNFEMQEVQTLRVHDDRAPPLVGFHYGATDIEENANCAFPILRGCIMCPHCRTVCGISDESDQGESDHAESEYGFDVVPDTP